MIYMETISIQVLRREVYEEVAKATDYTGSKQVEGSNEVRDRILASDDDLAELGRFWDESVMAVNENLKEMLIEGKSVQTEDDGVAYQATLEVSKSFDKALTASVQTTLRSFFIASIIGQWFKFANKTEAPDYFSQGAEMISATERLLYSRRKPTRPND